MLDAVKDNAARPQSIVDGSFFFVGNCAQTIQERTKHGGPWIVVIGEAKPKKKASRGIRDVIYFSFISSISGAVDRFAFPQSRLLHFRRLPRRLN